MDYLTNIDLQRELVAKSNLEYAVLRVNIVHNLCHAPVVASIKNDILILIRKAYWNSKVKTLYVVQINLYRITRNFTLHFS